MDVAGRLRQSQVLPRWTSNSHRANQSTSTMRRTPPGLRTRHLLRRCPDPADFVQDAFTEDHVECSMVKGYVRHAAPINRDVSRRQPTELTAHGSDMLEGNADPRKLLRGANARRRRAVSRDPETRHRARGVPPRCRHATAKPARSASSRSGIRIAVSQVPRNRLAPILVARIARSWPERRGEEEDVTSEVKPAARLGVHS